MRIDLTQLRITHDEAAHRFEAWFDDRRLGLADYVPQDGVWLFTHTEVDPVYRGQNVATVLIRAALDEARKRNKRIVPLCYFVEVFLRRYPEYQNLR